MRFPRIFRCLRERDIAWDALHRILLAIQQFEWVNSLQKHHVDWGLRPRGGSGAVFMSVIRKNCLAQRGPDEAAERPHQGWDTSRTKFYNISYPHEKPMSVFTFKSAAGSTFVLSIRVMRVHYGGLHKDYPAAEEILE